MKAYELYRGENGAVVSRGEGDEDGWVDGEERRKESGLNESVTSRSRVAEPSKVVVFMFSKHGVSGIYRKPLFIRV